MCSTNLQKSQHNPRLREATAEERFRTKWQYAPETGCYLWVGGSRDKDGYGRFHWMGKGRMAHRVAWELSHGPIPVGMVVDHICRVRSCVNPDHLRLVTSRQNVIENSVGFAATNIRKTACKHGHEFTPDNTYHRTLIKGHRGRHCKACATRRAEEWNRRWKIP